MTLKCENPKIFHNVACGCNRCIACRGRRRSEWMTRVELEKPAFRTGSVFVSLTYANLPLGGGLVNSHVTNFIKRIRDRLGYPQGLKYIVAGEYGSSKGRPHYHVVFFGIEFTAEVFKLIEDCWKFGFVNVRRVSSPTGAVSYITDYLLKSEGILCIKPGENAKDFENRTHLPAPFVHFSRGIGLDYFERHREEIRKNGLKIQGRRVVLPNYFKKKLRDSATLEQVKDQFHDVHVYYKKIALDSRLDYVSLVLENLDVDSVATYFYCKRRFNLLYSKVFRSLFKGVRISDATYVQSQLAVAYCESLDSDVVQDWFYYWEIDNECRHCIESVTSWNNCARAICESRFCEYKQNALNYRKKVELRLSSKKRNCCFESV